MNYLISSFVFSPHFWSSKVTKASGYRIRQVIHRTLPLSQNVLLGRAAWEKCEIIYFKNIFFALLILMYILIMPSEETIFQSWLELDDQKKIVFWKIDCGKVYFVTLHENVMLTISLLFSSICILFQISYI